MTSPLTQTNADVIPERVSAAALSQDLGALQRGFTPKRLNWLVVAFGLLLGLATTVFLVGFWLLWLGFRTPNLSRKQAAKRVYLFERGFILADTPDTPEVFGWDGVDTVFQKIVENYSNGIKTSTMVQYTITRRDGKTIKLTKFWNDVLDLGHHISTMVSQSLMPRVQKALAQGQTVQFGEITLSSSTIGNGRRTVPWSQVKDITVNRGMVTARLTTGKWSSLFSIATAEIPNLPLFLALASQLREAAQG